MTDKSVLRRLSVQMPCKECGGKLELARELIKSELSAQQVGQVRVGFSVGAIRDCLKCKDCGWVAPER